MNAAPRVLFVTRRFWPLANDNVWRVLNLAAAMRAAGWQPQVVTAQWHSAWPAQVELREFGVHRVGPSPLTPFRLRRYLRALCDWITQRGSHFDCIVVDAVEDEAHALVSHAASDLPPIVVRYDMQESTGPLPERLHARTITVCRQASLTIVPHEAARRQLASVGVPAARIVVSPDGPYSKVDRDDATRSRARRALADINHELFLRADQQLCIVVGDLSKNAGIDWLIQTLGPVLEASRGARCWIVGDGPERGRLYELVHRQGWRHEIVMPGTFEDIEPVLAAADLCIMPSASEGLSWLMPTALISGLPALLSDSPAARARLGTAAEELFFERGNPQQLRRKFEDWLRCPAGLQGPAARAAEHLLSGRSPLDTWRSVLGNFEKRRRA